MKLAFRCDSSELIGSGHVMRSLSLALALRDRGHDVLFMVRHLLPAMEELLSLHKICVIHLPWAEPERDVDNLYGSWLGVGSEVDAEAVTKVIREQSSDWVIVDHYALNADWERAVARCGVRICALDDLPDRKHCCDLLIDPNNPERTCDTQVGRVLAGPQYASVRAEFSQLRKKAVERSKLKNLLLFFGGADVRRHTHRVTEALCAAEDSLTDLDISVVVGASTPDIEYLQEYARKGLITLYVQTPDIAELMLKADLMLATASSVNWERCCLGVPALLMVVADNQRNILEYSVAEGSALAWPEQPDECEDVIQMIRELRLNPDMLKTMSRAAMSLCDGLGCQRICAELELIAGEPV